MRACVTLGNHYLPSKGNFAVSSRAWATDREGVHRSMVVFFASDRNVRMAFDRPVRGPFLVIACDRLRLLLDFRPSPDVRSLHRAIVGDSTRQTMVCTSHLVADRGLVLMRITGRAAAFGFFVVAYCSYDDDEAIVG